MIEAPSRGVKRPGLATISPDGPLECGKAARRSAGFFSPEGPGANSPGRKHGEHEGASNSPALKGRSNNSDAHSGLQSLWRTRARGYRPGLLATVPSGLKTTPRLRLASLPAA